MQLQAERDQFVHSGIGGGSSSSSTSPNCSPPKDSPFSLLTIVNLQKPHPYKGSSSALAAKTDTPRASVINTAAVITTPTTTAVAEIPPSIVTTTATTIITTTTTAATVAVSEPTITTAETPNHQHATTNDGIILATLALPPSDTAAAAESSMDIDISSSSQHPQAQQEPHLLPPSQSQQDPQQQQLESTTEAEPSLMEDVSSTSAMKMTIVDTFQQNHFHNSNTLNPPLTSSTVTATLPSSTPTSKALVHPSQGLALPCFGESTRLSDVTKAQLPHSSTAPTLHYPPELHPILAPALYPSEPASCAFIHEETLKGSQSTTMMDPLSNLPSELLFHIFCQLDALDLTRVAQLTKYFYRISTDNAVWRIKCMRHTLYSPAHLYGRQEPIPWLAYYRYLHRNDLRTKQNWANAVPQAVYVLEGHTGLVSALEMSIWSLVTASIDSTLRVWDLRTMECKQVLRSPQALTCVSQSEKARAVCARTSFGALCIWDMMTGELILQDPYAMPHIASFIYMDECYIGYGQCDGVVTIFNWSSRKELEIVGTYQAHEGDVIHISILDHKYVVSASTNGETLVYSIERSCIIERILLPHATQAIQFTPTIHGDKVMFSTRDAVYEYELQLDYLRIGGKRVPTFVPPSNSTVHNQNYAHYNQGRSINHDNNEISVFTRATKRVKQIHGPAVEAVLSNALRNRFYTTMECNEHCAVVSSGDTVYVISFLPTDL
ncbi:hypothetical protein FBU30_011304 [Linnemannia zychae]|nr:hypothetical protein FBU30_011304 [Linnemannia zychae]